MIRITTNDEESGRNESKQLSVKIQITNFLVTKLENVLPEKLLKIFRNKQEKEKKIIKPVDNQSGVDGTPSPDNKDK